MSDWTNCAALVALFGRPMQKTCNRGHERAAPLTTCPICSAERKARWAANNPQKVRSSNEKHAANFRERDRERHLAWRRANPHKLKAMARAHRAANRAKVTAASYAWREKNVERVRALARANYRRISENLADAYISDVTKVPLQKLAPEFIDAKRHHLRVMRLLKEKAK